LAKGDLAVKDMLRRLADSMHRADPSVCFAFRFWDGEELRFGEHLEFTLHLKSEKSAREMMVHRFFGFGEGYMSGEIEVEGNLRELLRVGLLINFDSLNPDFLDMIRSIPAYLRTRATPGKAKKNVAHHYDRGDEFYRLYLDETLTYSCAYFDDPDEPLEQAQLNKYEHIARKLKLKSGERLLDIGCGWGGMLIHAARKYGITGVGNTLSENQYRYAKKKIAELGLDRQISVILEDYRSLTGEFDKFVSIGMFEHVGREYIPAFMQKVANLLKKGGVGLLHSIGFEKILKGKSWHEKYVFPGNYIPRLDEVVLHMGQAGFSVLDVENLRLHYAYTLDRWIEKFERNENKIRQMFDETFVRMWKLYLYSSSAGFRYGENRVFQILFSNGLNNELPLTRSYVYGNGTP
jgi:cyclopropane-fatty-acyl-phospholipid synthase